MWPNMTDGYEDLFTSIYIVCMVYWCGFKIPICQFNFEKTSHYNVEFSSTPMKLMFPITKWLEL